MNIAIFVDSVDRGRRRYVYWLDYFQRRGLSPSLFAIPDLRAAVVKDANRSLPRLDEYDLIILNWDVANGDYAYLADETLEFFQNRGREELRRWASKGARIIVEIQSTGGFPMQSLYDAVLGEGEVTVSPYRLVDSHHDAQYFVIRNGRRARHPLVADVEAPFDLIETKYTPFHHAVFPDFDKNSASSYARHPAAIAWGNFTGWRKGWFPLILRTGKDVLGRWRMPVALAKSVGPKGGEIIATTMRIANSNNDNLLDAFCRVGDATRAEIDRFYSNAARSRSARRTAAIAAIWLLGLLVIVPAGNYADREFRKFLSNIPMRSDDSLLQAFTEHFSLVDLTGVAMVLTLLALSRAIWRQSDRR